MPHQYVPQQHTETNWHNPMKVPATFHVWKDGGRQEIVTIPPGATVSLPSDWDNAIQVVRNGRIEGGMAPQLQKVGGPKLPIAEALDSDAEEKKQRLGQIQKAEAMKRSADALLQEAAAQELLSTDEESSQGSVGDQRQTHDRAPQRSKGSK